MTLLNERYDYGLDLCLLSIDEGISGYRDASLDVRRSHSTLPAQPLTESPNESDGQAQCGTVRTPAQNSLIPRALRRVDHGPRRGRDWEEGELCVLLLLS